MLTTTHPRTLGGPARPSSTRVQRAGRLGGPGTPPRAMPSTRAPAHGRAAGPTHTAAASPARAGPTHTAAASPARAGPTHTAAASPAPASTTSTTLARSDTVTVFSAKPYVRGFLGDDLVAAFPGSRLVDARLGPATAALAAGSTAVVVFVNDDVSAPTVSALADAGVRLIALRCAGYDNVDLKAAAAAGIRVTRVPTYSPSSVAEHALALALALNRHIPRAHARAREGDYELSGLVGYEMQGKTVGIVGTGAIGSAAARLFKGIGCKVVAFDVNPLPEDLTKSGVRAAPDLRALLSESDVISLHVPLLPSTRHMIDGPALLAVKPHALLVNVSRGGLVDTSAVTRALEEGRLGGFAADVYEKEAGLFFNDWGDVTWAQRCHVGWDPVLSYLLSFPNVILTPHSAFLTHEALAEIKKSVLASIRAFVAGEKLVDEVLPK